MTRAIREALRAMCEHRDAYLAIDMQTGIAFIALDEDKLFVHDSGACRERLLNAELPVPDGIGTIVSEWGFRYDDGPDEQKWIVRHLPLDTPAQQVVDDLEEAVEAVIARARQLDAERAV